MGIFNKLLFDKKAVSNAIKNITKNFKGSNNLPLQPEEGRSFTFIILKGNRILSELTLLIPATNYRLVEPQRISVIKTPGGVHLEDFGPDNRTITLAGSFYEFYFGKVFEQDYSDADVRDPDRNLPIGARENFVSGRKAFYMFQDWITRWKEKIVQVEDTLNQYTVEFWNNYDGEGFAVAIQEFNVSKEKGDPFTHNYELRMIELYKLDDALPAVIEDYPFKENLIDLSRFVTGTMDTINAALSIVDAVIQPYKNILSLVANLRTGFIDPLHNNIKNAIENNITFFQVNWERAKDTLEQIGIIEAELEKRGVIEENKATNLESNLSALKQTMAMTIIGENLIDTKEKTQLSIKRNIYDSNNAIADAGSGFIITDGTFTQGDKQISRSSSRDVKKKYVTIRQGDTLVSLATKYYGDASLWYRIVGANGIKPEDISTLVGEQIIIPFNEPDNPKITRKLIYEKIDYTIPQLDLTLYFIKILGKDIKLDDEGNFILSGSGDLSSIKGLSCFEQGINLMTSIGQGELNPYHPNYGLPTGIGRVMSNASLKQLEIKLRKSILYDTRVSRINSLAFTVSGDQIFIEVFLIFDGINDAQLIKLKG